MATRTYQISGAKGFKGGKLQVNALKQYILVAGIDYHTGNSFIKYCNDYKSKVIANNKAKDDLTFIIIDLKGTIEIIENGKSVSIKNFDKISKSNYPAAKGHAFDALGKSNYITKKSIYELVDEIGLNKSTTLQELNIFSHAYPGGPILGNSSQSDAIDLDMRISDIKNKIFDFANFKKAFTNDGMVKIWGCQSHPPFNYLIKKIMQNPKYKKDGTTADTQEFIVNDIAVPNHEVLSKYIEAKNYTKLSNGTIKLTLSQVKKIFSTSYCTNYAAWLAYSVDVKVQYSLPATYASFGSPELFRISDDTKMNVPFFEKYLGISIGELDYGIYDKPTITKFLTP
ncbi:hypothetical protein [Flavobacterium sp. AJR]|uniref:hypothetical protein n=1 Tax=Flavobacterium sp. AJR TaxID=1979369 RepID=UPI000A3D7601|nr:hypothetical protein [Flavobacterium sp. AJR]OUL60339.1 hypothetical protein B8T70_20865 [Flavobacterium sp. AJR]